MQPDDNAIIPNQSGFRGRGAQVNPKNRFLQLEYVQEHFEGLDDPVESGSIAESKTEVFFEHPKKIINEVKSPDIGLDYSMNPYQGCEHGCVYCYARNTHTYFGFSSGLDFERKIIVKPTAHILLQKEISKRNYEVKPIMLSGNTDCYQPLEKKFEITRKMLEVLLKFKHPVGIITKNSLILRDLDLLKPLADMNLVSVTISITSLREKTRRALEPRTASVKKRLETVRILSEHGIPVNVNVAPIIPSINSDEIPDIIKSVAGAGAKGVMYTMVRLNGDVAIIFTDWVIKNYPDRADKILSQIKEVHGGTLGDSRFVTRMRGEGKIAEAIRQLFYVAKKKYFDGRSIAPLRCDLFAVPGAVKQMEMF